MRWDQDDTPIAPGIRGRRPTADTIIGPGRRLRLEPVQAEIERRVAIYTRQVERTGRITWLPFRGTGRSA